MVSVRAILIDLDNTLVDMTGASLVAFNEALSKHGLHTVSFEGMLACWKLPWEEVIKKLAPKGADLKSLMAKVGEDYLGNFGQIHLQYSKLISGTAETLKKLYERGFLIAIVSRRFRKIIKEELNKFNLSGFVDLIIGFEDVGSWEKQKPDPSQILLAAKRLNVPVQNCVIVGDSPDDIKAGRAVGAKTVAVLTGPIHVNRIYNEKPEAIVNSIADLIPALEGLISL